MPTPAPDLERAGAANTKRARALDPQCKQRKEWRNRGQSNDDRIGRLAVSRDQTSVGQTGSRLTALEENSEAAQLRDKVRGGDESEQPKHACSAGTDLTTFEAAGGQGLCWPSHWPQS